MDLLIKLFWIIVAYFIGSLPWALIIGKTFYKIDIRNYGSGNLGGSNAGRVLGKRIGMLVILLDASKTIIIMLICQKFSPQATIYAGLATAIGHCYPFFANFKGGKAVACGFGYLLMIGLFNYADFVFIFIYPLLLFLFILGLSKMVSLASLTTFIGAFLIATQIETSPNLAILLFIMCVIIIYRHFPNIKRILKRQENKISWLK